MVFEQISLFSLSNLSLVLHRHQRDIFIAINSSLNTQRLNNYYLWFKILKYFLFKLDVRLFYTADLWKYPIYHFQFHFLSERHVFESKNYSQFSKCNFHTSFYCWRNIVSFFSTNVCFAFNYQKSLSLLIKQSKFCIICNYIRSPL